MDAAPPPASNTPAPVVFSHRAILLIYSGLMLGMLLAALDQTIVSTALPTIVGDLGGLDHLSWVVTAYLLTSTVSVPLYGKLSDLYGRRRLFMAAIVLFLAGSALAGLSQTMLQLILFRGLQGLGGGGLFAMALTIIGDVVPPRQRGRYQGYMGAVFALSSIVGPYLGGFFVDNLSWRWIFYVNVPIGILALFVTSLNLRLPTHRIAHRIDYEGALLLVAATTLVLLGLVWGGNEYAWSSPPIVLLLGGGLALGALFVFVESRAQEPILPLRLFRNSIFTVSVLLSVVIGFAMFGATIFLPVFLQVVQGESATQSGKLILPMMAGIVAASIVSGRVITRTGRYKLWPIAGTILTALGLFLLSTMDAGTSRWLSALYMIVTGTGLGMFMQVLVLAVQNAVERRDLGSATSGVNFIRSLGSTFGVAIFGSIFAARVAGYKEYLNTPQVIRALPPDVRNNVIQAFADGVHTVFLTAVPVALVGVALAFLLKEIPLREAVHATTSEKVGEGLRAALEPGVPARAAPRLADPRPASRMEIPRIPRPRS